MNIPPAPFPGFRPDSYSHLMACVNKWTGRTNPRVRQIGNEKFSVWSSLGATAASSYCEFIFDFGVLVAIDCPEERRLKDCRAFHNHEFPVFKFSQDCVTEQDKQRFARNSERRKDFLLVNEGTAFASFRITRKKGYIFFDKVTSNFRRYLNRI
jgi:hypothetical protein